MDLNKVMDIANSPIMWLACAIPVIVVLLQAILFAKHAYSSGVQLGLSKEQMKRAIRSSATTSIGPSIVVLSGMLSLLVTVGGPIGWMRLSLIGSVMFESIAAGIGTSSVGITLGTDPMTAEALGMALWTMILCSLGWVIFSTITADKMDVLQSKLSKGNDKKLIAIASCSIIGVFAAMCAGHLAKPIYLNVLGGDHLKKIPSSYKNALSLILGAIIMFVLNGLAQKKNIGWLKEWALTIAILGAMIITALI